MRIYIVLWSIGSSDLCKRGTTDPDDWKSEIT
jgi:hypothetical protein